MDRVNKEYRVSPKVALAIPAKTNSNLPVDVGSLILSRRVGESVCIGDGVMVTVLAIGGNQIRLGFHAAKDSSIHRLEVYQRIQAEE